MLGSPHSNGLAALHCLLSKMAFLCAACWCWAARGVFGGSYPPWVRRSAHCKPPTQSSSRATGGGEWLPPVAPPVCHQHPSHPQGLGQHKQTTSWAGRSQFGFLLVETAVKRATSSEIVRKHYIRFNVAGQHKNNPPQ